MATRRHSGILAHTTSVDAQKTIAEISTLLIAKRATSIRTDYQEGEAVAIEFVVKVADTMVPFRLVPNIKGVYQKLKGSPTKAKEQAERTAWRILLRWIEAQMAMVEMNQADLGQLFLPYAVDQKGETFWAAFQNRSMKALEAGQ